MTAERAKDTFQTLYQNLKPTCPIPLNKQKGKKRTEAYLRVADGVYEILLDGMELEELLERENINVKHYLMVDAHYTWWVCGKAYLCRIVDMLHMGYRDEVLECLPFQPRAASVGRRSREGAAGEEFHDSQVIEGKGSSAGGHESDLSRVEGRIIDGEEELVVERNFKKLFTDDGVSLNAEEMPRRSFLRNHGVFLNQRRDSLNEAMDPDHVARRVNENGIKIFQVLHA